jgi:transketolase
MTDKAGSGHPTSCLSSAEIMSVLFFQEMRYDPNQLDSPDNDEFVMSKGHAAPILYAALAEAGSIPASELENLRTFDSPLEGHPVPRLRGIKAATGSLGQGLSVGIGLGLAMKIDRRDSRVFVLLGDGETAEGNLWEGMNYASHEGLDNLVGIVDINRLGQSEPTMFEWRIEEYRKRAEAFGWKVLDVDGHSVRELIDGFETARNDSGRPVMILARTVKGKDGGNVENENGHHGKPLPEDSRNKVIGDLESRIRERKVPDSVSPDNFIKGAAFERNDRGFQANPEYEIGEETATRDAFGKSLAALGELDEDIVVLDGDVKNSTRTKFFFEKFPDRGFECYIAEQNMIGVAVGLQARGKRVFTSTFAAFLTRAHDQVRMAGYSDADIRIAGSHTGVSIGEDGPSQMGLEDIAMMRALYNSTVLSPADAVSAEKLTAAAAGNRYITYIRTIRGKTPVIYSADEEFPLGGSKVLRRSDEDRATIVATGITVPEALEAAEELEKKNIPVRVIDCYSIKPIDGGTLAEAARETGTLITVEDHYPEGGLGEAVGAAVASKLSKNVGPTPPSYTLVHLAVRKRPHSGGSKELIAEQGIDASGIVDSITKTLDKG